MKLLIAGSRSIEEYDIKRHIDKDVHLIICRGAKGVDTLAERVADDLKISKLVLRPNYKRYGRAAPLVRNREMVEIADKVLVIWDGKSKGAEFTVKYATEKSKELIVVDLSKNREI